MLKEIESYDNAGKNIINGRWAWEIQAVIEQKVSSYKPAEHTPLTGCCSTGIVKALDKSCLINLRFVLYM